ncbi:amidohydrolase [Peloplasma aerotolerans]|uniref:Amidohydrolase n=1 Tax=Peloplasma aerotolerans TaxID=3044389 RepID=A0AAW6UAF3_9MOLU|nr:amidohydrolase [Mariniplasma sp. M4Ah]MDI6453417.1 amidohydrolase [Mariniplasma sp. M4Ah]
MKLWTNGFFHSMEDETTVYLQMATQDGVIIGFDEDIKDLAFDEIIDMNQGHVYPGFVDAHLHLLGYGQKRTRPNFYHLKKKNQVIEELKKIFHEEPLFVEGYFESGVNKDDLNAISVTQPILLRHNDYHSLTVNNVVLANAKIKSSTGVLTEDEAQKAIDSFPKYTKEKLQELLIESIQSLHQYGITGGHSDDLYYFNGFEETVFVFEKTLDKLPFRAHLLMHHLTLDDFLKSKRPFLDQNKYLQLGAVKMFYDGTLSSKTALMKKPYKNTNTFGLKVQSDQQFEKMIKKARKHHLPVAVHVIGDQATEDVCNLLKKHPVDEGLHDRLIHTPWLAKSTIELMKELPISLDIQPQFLSSDLPWALEFLSETPELCFPWKTLKENGINQAGSSDAPVEIPNPLLGIYAAIERKSDQDAKVYFESEKLNRFDAISLYTIQANFSTQHHNRGYLKNGYIADLSVFTYDLLTTDIENYKKDIVEMTVVDEQIVYRKQFV